MRVTRQNVLRKFWYAIVPIEKLDEGSFPFTLLGEPIVLRKDSDGNPKPSIIKDIGEVIRSLAARGDMAILLVRRSFAFARDLLNDYIVPDRGEVVIAGAASDMVESDVRRYLTV